MAFCFIHACAKACRRPTGECNKSETVHLSASHEKKYYTNEPLVLLAFLLSGCRPAPHKSLSNIQSQHDTSNGRPVESHAIDSAPIQRARSRANHPHTASCYDELNRFCGIAALHTTCAREQEGAFFRTPKRTETPSSTLLPLQLVVC